MFLALFKRFCCFDYQLFLLVFVVVYTSVLRKQTHQSLHFPPTQLQQCCYPYIEFLLAHKSFGLSEAFCSFHAFCPSFPCHNQNYVQNIHTASEEHVTDCRASTLARSSAISLTLPSLCPRMQRNSAVCSSARLFSGLWHYRVSFDFITMLCTDYLAVSAQAYTCAVSLLRSKLNSGDYTCHFSLHDSSERVQEDDSSLAFHTPVHFCSCQFFFSLCTRFPRCLTTGPFQFPICRILIHIEKLTQRAFQYGKQKDETFDAEIVKQFIPNTQNKRLSHSVRTPWYLGSLIMMRDSFNLNQVRFKVILRSSIKQSNNCRKKVEKFKGFRRS